MSEWGLAQGAAKEREGHPAAPPEGTCRRARVPAPTLMSFHMPTLLPLVQASACARAHGAAALKAVDGDPELLTDIARIFLSEMPRLLGEIEGAISGTDAVLLRRAAHTIKGGLRLFGAEAAYDLACRLESLGREGDFEAASEPFVELKQVVVELQQELSAVAVVPHVVETVNSLPSNP